MKGQTKTLAALAVILAVCLGAYLALRSWNQAQEAVDDTVYLVELADVTALSFTGTDGSDLSFTKADGAWTWDGDAAFPADQDALDALAENAGTLAAVRVFDEPDSLDAYGLDEPAYTVTVAGESGSATILIGDPVESNYYAMLEGSERVATISSALVTGLSVGLMDLAEPEQIPDVTEETLASIRWQSGGSGLLLEKETLTEDVTDEESGEITTETTYRWTVNGTEIPEDNEALDTLLSEITYLYFSACYDYAADAETRSACGLDEPMVLTYTDEEGSETTLSIGAQDESGEYYYASLNDSGAIQLLSNSAVEAFTALTEETLTAAPEADGESGS